VDLVEAQHVLALAQIGLHGLDASSYRHGLLVGVLSRELAPALSFSPGHHAR